MDKLLITAFVNLLVIVNPFGAMPVFYSLTHDLSDGDKKRTALKASITALILLILFALLGQKILNGLQIPMPAFQLAGGLLLFIIAFETLFNKRQERKEKSAGEINHMEDYSIFPIGIPLLCGPGALTFMILQAQSYRDHDTPVIYLVPLACLVMLITYVLFRLTIKFKRFITPSIAAIIIRFFGILLAAQAANHIISGIKKSFMSSI